MLMARVVKDCVIEILAQFNICVLLIGIHSLIHPLFSHSYYLWMLQKPTCLLITLYGTNLIKAH